MGVGILRSSFAEWSNTGETSDWIHLKNKCLFKQNIMYLNCNLGIFHCEIIIIPHWTQKVREIPMSETVHFDETTKEMCVKKMYRENVFSYC